MLSKVMEVLVLWYELLLSTFWLAQEVITVELLPRMVERSVKVGS